ncbi:MAG TPA: hypothetical protein DDZ51_28065 [Planctomycetaceae bacterium]|nr:hypothetical protein [Planctomycetaceae bacterium]
MGLVVKPGRCRPIQRIFVSQDLKRLPDIVNCRANMPSKKAYQIVRVADNFGNRKASQSPIDFATQRLYVERL